MTTIEGKTGNPIYRVWVKGKASLLKLADIIYENANSHNFHVYKRVYMTQHANQPYDVDDSRDIPRWKFKDGKLVHTNNTRISFRTNISQSILESLKQIAEEKNTHVNYLLEDGLKKLLTHEKIVVCKELRPKDRIQYKTTYDQDLLIKVKAFAKKNHLFINDVIEYSVRFIDD